MTGPGIVFVLCLDGTAVPGFITAVTDIRCFLYLSAGFAFEPWTNTVTSVTGTAERVTDHDLVTGICFFTVETVDTEVVRVIKAASVPCINGPVPPDLFGNGRGIFAEIFGYRLKGSALIEGLFYEFTVFKCKMFVVSRY